MVVQVTRSTFLDATYTLDWSLFVLDAVLLSQLYPFELHRGLLVALLYATRERLTNKEGEHELTPRSLDLLDNKNSPRYKTLDSPLQLITYLPPPLKFAC